MTGRSNGFWERRRTLPELRGCNPNTNCVKPRFPMMEPYISLYTCTKAQKRNHFSPGTVPPRDVCMYRDSTLIPRIAVKLRCFISQPPPAKDNGLSKTKARTDFCLPQASNQTEARSVGRARDGRRRWWRPGRSGGRASGLSRAATPHEGSRSPPLRSSRGGLQHGAFEDLMKHKH